MKQEETNLNSANRRSFLKGAGITGLGLASAAIVGGGLIASTQKAEAATYSDLDILKFALNLEYLEAEFYAVSTYGVNLKQLGILKAEDESGPTTGGQKVPGFSKMPSAFIASALRMDELEHVVFLRQALGSQAIKKPTINLNAMGYGFQDVWSWLKLARQLEDVGISAYLGAAPLISSSKYLAAAAAILATEAQHSGALRLLAIQKGVKSPAVDSKDVPPTPSMPFDTGASSLSVPRTTSEVLKIVYAGGTSSGGFFPSGLNGAITSR